MAVTQLYTAVPGDTITAARWNNEFGNIYDNLGDLEGTSSVRNVKVDFGAIADGVANDTSVVQAAVSEAYTTGGWLYWPEGTYLTTASITNLHDVRHVGPGVIKRGSNTFYVDPADGQSNILYVATTGSGTNDGLSANEPLLTAQNAGDALMKYRWNLGSWTFQFAAGTYASTTARWEAKQFPTVRQVKFLGAPVATGTTPTTIFDSPGGAAKIGFYVKHFQNVYLEDIKFTDYADTGSPVFNNGGTAILADQYSVIYLKNVWVDNCDVGIQVSSFSYLFMEAGIVNNCAVGVQTIFHTRISLGYLGSAADANGITGTVVKNCSNTGVLMQESCTGHTDYTYFDTCGIGLTITVNSRSHSIGSSFNTCSTAAVRVDFNSTFYDTSCTFAGNGTNLQSRTGGRLGAATGVDETLLVGPTLYELDSGSASTQSATPVTWYTYTFDTGEFTRLESWFKLRLYGEVVGVANTKTIVVTLGATTLLTATLAAGTTDYQLEVFFVNRTAATTKRLLCRLIENGASPTITNSSPNVDVTGALTLTVTHQVTNVADLHRPLMVELEIMH